MKMKEVCQRTGLTDRTVRLYISYGLVFPNYSENYTGRKNYTFSEEDTNRLQQIAHLRRYGFSISDIKEILEVTRPIPEILNEHIDGLKKQIEKESAILAVLEKTANSDHDIQDADTLCHLLERDGYGEPDVPDTDRQPPFMSRYDRTRKTLKIIIIAFIACVLLFVIGFFLLFGSSQRTLYGAKARSSDSVVTEYFDETKIGNCKSYSYSLHLKSSILFCSDGSVLLAEYEAEDFEKQLEVVEQSYRFLDHQVLDPYNETYYLSPPPVFTIGNWVFKTISYHVLEDEHKCDYPKSFQMIAVNEQSQKIAYLDFRDNDLDFLGTPDDADYMEQFIKDNFHTDFSRIP